MAPRAEALPKSESKKNFLDRIGLKENQMKDRRLYDIMKREASDGRSRIIAAMKAEGPASTLGPASYGPDGEEFFPSSYVGDQILSDESLRVYNRACPDTRKIYDLAFDPDRPRDPNWIIRWFLWHVFRYRDGRQARQKLHHPKARPIRPFPYRGSKEDHRRNALLYESASKDSCPRTWRPYNVELKDHYSGAPHFYDVAQSFRTEVKSHYTTSPPMRNEERSRFAASSGISKPSYRSGRRYDPVRDILI
ncbi:uncharacterized protein K489DRAFT_435507 [Dissoconium aciculare CBS 342.82]|uniref:Uncharacterized protein n=1 Tax=Dissoconium aciculare CBS 342.82 TaxID=1314786 RepID=A0A6J3LPZ1_9PEZI|nr:uncharacterized protein K489DRAFT_435507 [Dissoconium aciculare CBS 342.82]KAF1817991.1 hypothetical protein K489DRAFT_435507 [Dissoconium aciculare CBS 342.82]